MSYLGVEGPLPAVHLVWACGTVACTYMTGHYTVSMFCSKLDVLLRIRYGRAVRPPPVVTAVVTTTVSCSKNQNFYLIRDVVLTRGIGDSGRTSDRYVPWKLQNLWS